MREPFTFLHRFTFALFCDLGRRDPFLPISAALQLCVEKYAHSDLSFQPQSRRSPGGSARLVCQTKLTPAISHMYAQIDMAARHSRLAAPLSTCAARLPARSAAPRRAARCPPRAACAGSGVRTDATRAPQCTPKQIVPGLLAGGQSAPSSWRGRRRPCRVQRAGPASRRTHSSRCGEHFRCSCCTEQVRRPHTHFPR